MKLRTLVVLCALLVWAGVRPAHAQTISSVDLNGTWSVFQLATPIGPFGNASVHTYRGTVTLNAAGGVMSGALDDNQQPVPRTFDVAGTLTITPAGVIDGTLALDDHLGDTGELDVREARLLFGKHTIIGVATILGEPGLFTFVKHQAAPFTLDGDLAGEWTYHEITPKNLLLPPPFQGEATWTRGTITFAEGTGDTQADLTLADGTVRAQDTVSFGVAAITAGGAVTGSAATFDAQTTSDVAGTPAERDLILGLTSPSDVGAPGLVTMTKIQTSPPAFGQSDLAGPWRVYLHRVEASQSASTVQTGLVTLSSTGSITSGTLKALDDTPTTLAIGSLLVSANGSVTGTLGAAGALGDSYAFRGTMRGVRDVVSGVLTARVDGRTTTYYGLASLVREVTLFDLGQSTYSVSEGGSVTVTVLRSGNRTGTATVHYEANGGTAPPGDYQPASGTLTFGPGVATGSFTVKTNANTLVDGNRSVTLSLSTPTGVSPLLGATPTATLNIIDEDRAGTVKLGTPTYSLTESTKNAAIVIQRANGAASGVVVQFATSDGTALAGRDYTAVSSSVTFGAGETTKTVLVPIADTPIVDGSRSFTFALTGATPPSTVIGTPGSAVVTIGDLDVAGTVQFSAATYTTTEPLSGSGSVTVTVTRTGGMAGGVRVDFATADGTATAGADYTATTGTLTFDLGNTSKTFSIPILADAVPLVEGDETVLLTLSNPLGGATLGVQKTAVLTIKDAQSGVQFSAPTFSSLESAAGATITVARTGPTASAATVRYSTSDGTAKAGTNYRATAGTLTFAAGATKATFTVPLIADKQVTDPQNPPTVLLLLSGPVNTGLGPLTTAVLTIGNVDVAGTVKLASPTFSITEAAGAAVITVSRSGGTASGVSIDYAASDQPCGSPPCDGQAQGGFDYQAVTGTLTFGAGETTKTILIPVTNDTQVNGNRTFLVTLSNPQGGASLGSPGSAVVTIVDDDKGGVFQFSAPTYSATEPTGVSSTATVTVTRTGTSLAGASVQFATSNGTAVAGTDYASTISTLVFGAGETSKAIPVPLLVNPATQGNKTVNLSLANPGGGATLGSVTSAVLTVVDSVASARFSSATYSVTEGAAATITVLRGGPMTGTLKVDYITNDGTATAGVDYTARVGTLTFGPGVTSQSFTVPTTANSAAGDDGRTVGLTLTSNGGSAVAPPSTATITINDNDASGTFSFGAATYAVTEGGAPPQIVVNRAGGSGGTVLVSWSTTGGTATGGALPTTPGADYAPASGVLTFGPGVTSLKLPLTIVNDTVAEDSETVTLTLALPAPVPAGAALGATASTTVTILDNDNGGTMQFALANQTVAENVAGGKASLMVTRAGTALGSGVLVDYTASGDTGAVTLPPGTLTFGAGQASAPIAVPIVANGTAEPDRLVTVTLSNPRSIGPATGSNAPTLGALTSTTLKIIDDEPRLQFAAAAPTVTEGGTATIGVTRTGSTTGQVTVDYATGGGTAVANTHYTPASGTLTFPSGTSSRTFTVPTTDDGLAAGSRTVGLALSNAVGASIGGTNPATLTIVDKESAGVIQFASASATVVEGQPGDPGRTLHVTVTRTGTTLVGPVTVGWSATGGTATAGSDFSPSSGSLTFEGSATSQSFDIVAPDDGVIEGTETIVLSLGPPTGGAALGSPSAMTVFIVDAQQSVAFASSAFTVGETTPQAVISVMRVGVPTGPVTVTATTVVAAVDPSLQAVAGMDYTSVSTVLTFATGEIVKTFNVPILTANALTRNGNRVVGLELSAPVNAGLVGASSANLTILDFRPDLVIASVGTPGNTLTGKTLSAPTTVKNLGQVASPSFRVGVFMARDTGSPDDSLPGAGTLVVQRDVPALAAGATTALPTQLSIADDLPAGNYFVSAVANFNQSVTEADATNNGLSSSPSVLKVSSSLSKFQSASASFSLASASSGTSALSAPQVATCDVAGSVNLTGSFTILSQQLDTATGVADLSGSFNGEVVRFLIGFTGTSDTNNIVNATLTSIVVSGAFSATGSGTPPGTFTGTINTATLSGTATGSIHTSTGGDCVFSGPLSAVAQTSFVFRFGTQVTVGTFAFNSTPDNVPTEVDAGGYAAKFRVLFDSNLPDPSTVRFTGPTGSGVTNTAADPGESHRDDEGTGGTYVSPPRSGVAPGGTWSVLYKGLARAFNVPSFDANRSLVVILPTVTVDSASNTLTRVDWIYQDRFGNRVTGTPSSIKGLRLQIWMNSGGTNQPESGDLAPTVTSFTFATSGITPPDWGQVNAVVFQYEDLAGNEYQIEFQKTFAVQVETRLENVYAAFSPLGSHERIINAFVNVPAFSVDSTAALPCTSQLTPPFNVGIQNRVGTANLAPYDNVTCMDRTSTTFFPNSPFPVDIYSARDNLDNYRNTSQAFPVLPVGTQFEFAVDPSNSGAAPQTVTTTLQNAEANPITDFISIPNPATPVQKPSGFRLSDAKLGQNMTVSWTLPTSFAIGDIMLTANVTADQGLGQGGSQPSFTLPPLTCTPASISLPIGTTSATFKFPASCLGTPVTQAQFCIFITGTEADQHKRSTACWFFQ